MSTECAWLRSEGILEAVLESSSYCVVAVGADDTVSFANAMTRRTFGWAEDELVGASLTTVLAPGLVARLRHYREPGAEPDDDLMGSRPDFRFEGDGLLRDGTTLPVELSLNRVVTPLGTWVLCAIADISARRDSASELAQVSRDYRTLAALNQAIVRSTDDQELFESACRIATLEGGYLGAWVVSRGEADEVVTRACAGALSDQVDRVHHSLAPDNPLSGGPTAVALLEDRAVFSADVLDDAEPMAWHATAAAFGVRGAMALPLRRDGEQVAVLTLWCDRPRLVEAEHRALLEGFASNISYTLDGFAAEERLARLVEQRGDLLRRVMAAQDEERARIAADVHDDSVQSLAAVDLQLGLLARRVHEVAPELTAAMQELRGTVSSVTSGLRHLLFDLESPDAGHGFDEALRDTARHLFDESSVTWSVTVEREDGRGDTALHLAADVHTQALRIAKEALINVRKHARADTVRLSVRTSADGVEVEICDDGVGVSLDLVKAPGHLGFSAMRDRAELLGGSWRVEALERGTRVCFWVPWVSPTVRYVTHPPLPA